MTGVMAAIPLCGLAATLVLMRCGTAWQREPGDLPCARG